MSSSYCEIVGVNYSTQSLSDINLYKNITSGGSYDYLTSDTYCYTNNKYYYSN